LTPADVAEEAIKLARTWEAAEPSAAVSPKERASTELLAKLVQNPKGMDFTMAFVDRVARPEDNKVAARELRALARSGNVPKFIAASDRTLLGVGGRLAPLAPDIAMPLARARLRQMVGHLVVDASDPTLANHIARAKANGYRLNLNLLGEAVLGDEEANRRVERTIELVRRPDVDYISIKISSLASQIITWDRVGSVARAIEHLRPLLDAAKECGTFINMDMEEYHDLDLTMDVFEQALMMPEYLHMEAGIVIQCYLPDALGAIKRLVEFADKRKAAGGASIKVRFVKGANLSMEQVEASLHGWQQAIYMCKEDVDANYLRVVDWTLRPEHLGNLHVGVAGHNLFHLATAYLLAKGRGVLDNVEFEMLQGMAPAQADAVRDTTGGVRFYTPVVHKENFDVAISYLVRRLEENAAPQNFLYQQFSNVADPLAVPQQKFLEAIARLDEPTTDPLRGRTLPVPETGFYNEPDVDSAVQVNRDWALACLAADPGPVQWPVVTKVSDVDACVERAEAAQKAWGALPAAERARVLRLAADKLKAHRGDLVAVMAHEGGKTVAESDPEVSEAIDFARYYAQCAEETLDLPGVKFDPVKVTAVIPPWNFPVSIPTGGMMAALAAGSAVIIKPAKLVRRCGETAVAAIHEAFKECGVSLDTLQVLHVKGGDLGKRLVTHPKVDAVVLTGSIETASMFAGWRPDLKLYAETSGKNALIVTPSADIDLAVADLVKSAFSSAGQKCSAASLAILVGSVYSSPRFRAQLTDAVKSMKVGWGTDISTNMGPLIEPPGEKLMRGLTELDPGEHWLVKPKQLDETGRLWSPGVRDGVEPGSWFHLTECFGPVLGLMHADTLEEAIDLQNATAFGLTGGIHSLDQAEIDEWCDKVEVGNAYVNRHITGAIVRRQSFGGWKGSAVGPGAKAGGPNYVAEFGTWTEAEPVTDPEAWLEAARQSDIDAWNAEFGVEHDPDHLKVEANIFRYRPLPAGTYWVRAGADAKDYEVRRVIGAARIAGLEPRVSRASSEPDEVFAARVASGEVSGRIRVVGTAPGLREAAAGRLGELTVLDFPVTGSGRRELLCCVREQALSITKHRYGHVAD
jgi:RHH-type proline utilization regulon transcriptional repressor/proline dehydrogenase/delta 1-pyrroline-5-carboxylate dehydrogenase